MTWRLSYISSKFLFSPKLLTHLYFVQVFIFKYLHGNILICFSESSRNSQMLLQCKINCHSWKHQNHWAAMSIPSLLCSPITTRITILYQSNPISFNWFLMVSNQRFMNRGISSGEYSAFTSSSLNTVFCNQRFWIFAEKRASDYRGSQAHSRSSLPQVTHCPTRKTCP